MRVSALKLGAAFPSIEVQADAATVRAFVRGVEQLGYDRILVPDHVLKVQQADRDPPLNGPYTEKDSFPDPFVLMAFMAALTDKLDFVTGILVLPQRQTAVVAQQSADVDILSNERLTLGVGIGWNHVEYSALGMDFRSRAKRIEEQIFLLRALWTQPLVSFEGRFDRIDRACINPRPRRSIPLWLGGHSEPAYERGARLGDGFVFANGQGAFEALERIRHHLQSHGRNENMFGKELLTQFADTPSATADQLKPWRDVGGTHGSVQSTGRGLGADLQPHLDYLAETKRLVDLG